MHLRLLLLFYSNLAPASLVVSITNAIIVYIYPSASSAVLLTWAKVIINGIIGFSFWYFKRNQFYFYQNAGYTTQRLFTLAFVLDITLWIIFLTLFFSLR